jgi:2'-5' RNA ligase
MIKKQTIVLMMLIAVFQTQAGVYVLVELPKVIIEKVQEAQQQMALKVKELNTQEDGTVYEFQSAQFAPHLSLAFVSQEELSVRDAQEKLPNITQELQGITYNHKTIDIGTHFKDAAIDYWPGKFEVECGESKKKNYMNVVLKASNNEGLLNLANDIRKVLKEKYNIEQRFPFSTHVTIGRVYERDDKPLDDSLRQGLEKIGAAVAAYQSSKYEKPVAIVVDTFKLKGHDGSEELFALSL